MTSSKLILILSGIILSSGIIWSLSSSRIEQAKTVPYSNTNLIESYNSLLNRIEALENELTVQQSIQQQYEEKLRKLEQTLINSNSKLITEQDLTVTTKTQPPVIIKPLTLEEKLQRSNIPANTIQQIQQLIGKNNLARLQLRDQAIREDWIDNPEYFEKLQQLPGSTEGIRDQFGDQVFDEYLYAADLPNRVIVREVFSGSAAMNAGIEPGDIILSYASDKIFTMGDLQQATTEGLSGESVLIELQRDDILLTTSVPRGPLGISMTSTKKEPE